MFGLGGAELVIIGMISLLLLPAYCVPWIVAAVRKHPRATKVAVINILLGWTFVGWVVALLLACSNPQPRRHAQPAS